LLRRSFFECGNGAKVIDPSKVKWVFGLLLLLYRWLVVIGFESGDGVNDGVVPDASFRLLSYLGRHFDGLYWLILNRLVPKVSFGLRNRLVVPKTVATLLQGLYFLLDWLTPHSTFWHLLVTGLFRLRDLLLRFSDWWLFLPHTPLLSRLRHSILRLLLKRQNSALRYAWLLDRIILVVLCKRVDHHPASWLVFNRRLLLHRRPHSSGRLLLCALLRRPKPLRELLLNIRDRLLSLVRLVLTNAIFLCEARLLRLVCRIS